MRWDCPPEYVQYQQLGTKPPPLPKEPYPTETKKESPENHAKHGTGTLVSNYDDSDDESDPEVPVQDKSAEKTTL